MYPVSLDISGRRCVVVGGGNVAERKVLSLLEAGGSVRIISPQVTDTLAGLAADSFVEWLNRGYQSGDLDGALLVFAATDSHEVQDAVVRDANQVGLPVNVADSPDLCSFQVPAVARRGDLTIAVSTNGKSPALAANIREQLQKRFGEEYAVLLRLLSRLRKEILVASPDCAERKILFQNILHDDILQWIKTEQWELLRKHLAAVLGPNIDIDFCQLKEKR